MTDQPLKFGGKTMHKIGSIAGAILFALSLTSSVWAQEDGSQIPVGETAHYQVVKDSNRTTGFVRGGTVDLSVVRIADGEQGPAYEIQLDYGFDVAFLGQKSGNFSLFIPKRFFTPGFMEELRQNGEFQAANFKIRHLGIADTRTSDGNHYSNCDQIEFYDFKGSDSPGSPLDLNSAKIKAHIKPGIPVLGAAKVDIQARAHGIRFKVGVDYKKP